MLLDVISAVASHAVATLVLLAATLHLQSVQAETQRVQGNLQRTAQDTTELIAALQQQVQALQTEVELLKQRGRLDHGDATEAGSLVVVCAAWVLRMCCSQR